MAFLSPCNDIVFKKLFGTEQNLDLLQEFLNDLLYENEVSNGIKPIEHIEFLHPEFMKSADSKKGIVDILCRLKSGEKFIVEMQIGKISHFVRRAEFYITSIFSNQIKPGGYYGSLKPAKMIIIANYDLFEDHKGYIMKNKFTDILEDGNRCYFDGLEIVVLEVKKFMKKKNELKTMLDKWLYFFKNAENEISNIQEDDQYLHRAYTCVMEQNFTQQERNAYFQLQIDMMDMQMLKEGMREEAIKKLANQIKKDALVEGEKKGMEKGMEKKAIENAKRMFLDKMPDEMIIKYSGISIECLDELKRKK